MSGEERRVVEVELDLTRISLLLLAVALIASASYCAGRASAGGAGVAANPFERTATALDEGETLELDEGNLFDRVGSGGSAAAPERQVAPRTRSGAFELDLGVTTSREEAERAKERLEAEGIAAFVTTGESGRYRLAAGPFESEDEARRIAAKIESRFGTAATIRKTGP